MLSNSRTGRMALLTDGIYPFVMGGMQRHSFLLAKYLAMAGWEIDLYHRRTKESDLHDSLPGVREDAMKRINLIPVDFPHSGSLPGHYLKESSTYSQSIYGLFQKRAGVDVIYAKGFTAWAFYKESKKGKIPPIALNMHGLEMFQVAVSLRQLMEQWLLRGPARYNLRQADHVFSYGGKITQLHLKLGIKKDRIVELPAGVEKEVILDTPVRRESKKRKFVFMGRWERRKGVEELNTAIDRFNFEPDRVEFHFIGPIPENKRLTKASVVYHGPLSNTDTINAILRQCDVLVCPSLSEGMPNVILEAMSQGLAVIATDVGAVSLMVDSSNGILVEKPKPDLLIEAFRSLTDISADALHLMKQSSIDKCRTTFNWDRIGTELVNWLNSFPART